MQSVHNPEDALYTPAGRQRSGLHPRYVWYVEGGIYYAKALTPGYLDYFGPVADVVYNAALANGGGHFVKAGTYVFTDTDADGQILNISRSATVVEGEGYGAYQGAGDPGTYFYYWQDLQFFHIHTTNFLIEGVELRGFKIENLGGNKTVAAIHMEDASYCVLDHVYVNMQGGNCPAGVLRLDAVNLWCTFNSFYHVHVRGFGTGKGISIQASAGMFCTVNHFTACRAFQGATGLDLGNEAGKTGDVDYNVFVGNGWDTTTADGVLDNGGGNKFTTDVFMDTVGGDTYHGTAASLSAGLVNCGGTNNALGVNDLGGGLRISCCEGTADQ